MSKSDLRGALIGVAVATLAIAASSGGVPAGVPAGPNVVRSEATSNQPPVSWPAETIGAGGWTVYTQMGVALEDKSAADGDCSTGGSSPSGAADIVRGDPPTYYPSTFWAYDSTNQVFYYRVRIAAVPLTNAAESRGTRTGGDPWTSITWNMLIDADNDGWREFTIVLDGDGGGKVNSDISAPGSTSDGDDLKIYYKNDGGQCVTTEAVSGNQITNPYDLVWWGNAGTKDAVVPGSPTADGATWDFGRTRCVFHSASSAVWGRGYFVDFQFPVSALTDAYNGGSGGTPLVGLDTPLAFGYSTSNSNQDPLQKDYATGFCYTAGCDVRFPYSDIVTLGEGTLHGPLIGAMSLSAVVCPSAVTVCAAVASALQVVPPYTGGGGVEDTIAWVRFEHFFDSDADGMDDDAGSSWTDMTVVGPAPNPDVNGTVDPSGNSGVFNDWGVVWNTSSLAEGQYLIRVTASDDQGIQARKVVGSYVLAVGACGPGPNLSWVSFEDAAHAVPSDAFGCYLGKVHMAGSFQSLTPYAVAFYDAGGTLLVAGPATSGTFGDLVATLEVDCSGPWGLYHAVVFPAGTPPPVGYGAAGAVADDSFWVLPGLLRNADVTQITPYQDPPNSSLFFQAHPLEPAIDPSVTRYQEKLAFVSGADFPSQADDLTSASSPLIFYNLVGCSGETLRVTKGGGKVVIQY